MIDHLFVLIHFQLIKLILLFLLLPSRSSCLRKVLYKPFMREVGLVRVAIVINGSGHSSDTVVIAPGAQVGVVSHVLLTHFALHFIQNVRLLLSFLLLKLHLGLDLLDLDIVIAFPQHFIHETSFFRDSIQTDLAFYFRIN